MRILIIDDDPMVRSVCSGMLQHLNHEPVTCASGDEALRILAEPDEQFDLLILDDLMPDMSGIETLSAMAAREIAIPVIFCSGSIAANDRCSSALGHAPVGVLSKPFTMQTLKSLLDKMQENPPER